MKPPLPKGRCPTDTVVWVNLPYLKVYHFAVNEREKLRHHETRRLHVRRRRQSPLKIWASKTEKHPLRPNPRRSDQGDILTCFGFVAFAAACCRQRHLGGSGDHRREILWQVGSSALRTPAPMSRGAASHQPGVLMTNLNNSWPVDAIEIGLLPLLRAARRDF